MLDPRVFAALGVSAVKNQIASTVKRIVRRAALMSVAGLLWLLVFGFALAAFTVWLAGQIGAVAALAWIAGGFAVIAVIIHIILAVTARRRPKPGVEAHIAARAGGTTAEADLGGMGAVAIFAAIGFLLGRAVNRRKD